VIAEGDHANAFSLLKAGAAEKRVVEGAGGRSPVF
jgi:hypothetical protein